MGNVYFSFIQYRETLLKCGFILYGPVWMHGIFFTSPPLAPNSPKKSKQRAISELFANILRKKKLFGLFEVEPTETRERRGVRSSNEWETALNIK